MAGLGRPGPAPMELGHSALGEILGHIGRGYGRQRACELAGVPYRTFRRRLSGAPDLLDQVATAEGARAGECQKRLFDLGSHPNPMVAIAALKAFLAWHKR